MNTAVFDGIAREMGGVSTRRSFFRLFGGAAALSAGLALGGSSLAKGKSHGKSKAHSEGRAHGRSAVAAQRRGGAKKITICFQNQTLTIKKSKLGNFPGATRGACGKQNGVCTSWILSGGADPNASIVVDDDLQVMVNGTVLQPEDKDGMASTLAPFKFTANPGASLGIVARDANPAARSLSPLWLHCATKPDQKRQLFAGNNDGAAPGRVAGTFVSEVYTI
jgi:hypothetical protein